MGRESIIRSEQTYKNFHFAEATRVGDTIWVSGQRGFDAADEISDDPTEQARVAFQNIEGLLRAAGASVDDIVHLTSYHVNMADLIGFVAVKDEFLTEPYPAWTAVGTTALAAPEMLVEVAVVAVIGSGADRIARRI